MRSADRNQLQAIVDELETVRPGHAFLDVVMPQIHALIGWELTIVYSLRSTSGVWEIERWDGCGEKLLAARDRAATMFASASEFPLYYDPMHPPREQRNRVIDALAWIDDHAPGTWERSAMYREVLQPLALGRHHQPRALLCDGPCLLGWFGGMNRVPATPRQVALLEALVEPMRRRLRIERRLASTPHLAAALEVMLDRVGVPTYLIDSRGAIKECNVSGLALLDEQHADITSALVDAIAGRPARIAFELVPLRAAGAPDYWLAITEHDRREARIAACVQACVERWRLTARQADVLALVTRGLANATIASMLRCVERTIELHVTTLLDRAGVDSRAALVSVVLTSA